MIHKISSRKLLLLFALFITFLGSFLGLSVKAVAQEVFTIQGTYARTTQILGLNAGNGLGICPIDEGGNFSNCSFMLDTMNIVNQERVDATLTMAGTFTVNLDVTGTGILVETVTFPDGSTIEATSDFVITQVVALDDGTQLVTEISALQRGSLVTPGVVTSTFKRLSD